MTLLLSPWFWLAVILEAAWLLALGGTGGYQWAQRRYELQRAQEQVENEKRTQRMLERNLVIVPEYVEGKTQIQKVFVDRKVYIDRVIEKVVPHEIRVESDRACGAMPVWFVELWNSANQARLPDAAKGVDGGPTDIVLTDVAAQHDREAEIAATNELQLAKLKKWIREQYEAVNGAKAPY